MRVNKSVWVLWHILFRYICCLFKSVFISLCVNWSCIKFYVQKMIGVLSFCNIWFRGKIFILHENLLSIKGEIFWGKSLKRDFGIMKSIINLYIIIIKVYQYISIIVLNLWYIIKEYLELLDALYKTIVFLLYLTVPFIVPIILCNSSW